MSWRDWALLALLTGVGAWVWWDGARARERDFASSVEQWLKEYDGATR